MRAPLPSELAASRLVAVMRGLGALRCLDVAEAVRDGGMTVVEVTMDSPDAVEAIGGLASQGHIVGAGTVMSIEEAQEAVDAGATFLVAPHTDAAVVRWAVENRYPMIPGAYTPSEVLLAWNLGAAAVKLFPASIGGASLVRSIAAPFGHIPLVVTGGMDASNVGSFLAAGAAAAGIGGWLVGSTDLDTIRERAALLVRAVESANV